jgi:fibronectin-binding autotransporter adhesin
LGTGAVSNNASLVFNRSNTLTVSNVITGAGAIRQVGSGLTNLTANSTAFVGTTSIEAGALAVNGSLCGTMNVQSGGKLQGTGRVCDTNNFTGGIVAPGNSIGTLTIAGNYTGNGGVLEMETILSGTGSPADRLLITGNATGTTQIKTINLGGTGALTGSGNSDGVSIIQVGGASTAGNFQLQGGYAAAGPYQYRLNFFAPGASAAAQADPLLGTAVFGDYRLQSVVDASGAPVPVPQIPGYQAMPTGALRYGASLLNGLHKRLGEIRQFASVQTGKEEGVRRREFFLREQSSRSDFSGDQGPDFDQDIRFVQVGGNFIDWGTDENGSTLRLGGALSYGRSNLGTRSSSAKVDLKGLTLAMMTTYQGAKGEYIDLVAQGTQYHANVRTSERGNTGNPKGWGLGLSVEGGYPYELDGKLTLEPQVQLVYQRVRFDRFTDVDNITVDLENGKSLRGRVGVRVKKMYEIEGQEWSPYAEINLLHEFLKGSTIQASGVGFRSDSGGTGLQLGAGLNGKLGRDTTLFLTLGYEKGIGKGSADTLSGTVGMRMSF